MLRTPNFVSSNVRPPEFEDKVLKRLVATVSASSHTDICHGWECEAPGRQAPAYRLNTASRMLQAPGCFHPLSESEGGDGDKVIRHSISANSESSSSNNMTAVRAVMIHSCL